MDVPRGGLWRSALRSTVPTREGRRVLEGAIVLLGFAYVTQRSSLFWGGSLLLALYLVGHLGAAYAASRAVLSWDCPARVWAREPFPLRLVVRNSGLLPVAGFEVHEPAPGRPGAAAVLPAVLPGRAAPVEVRGVVRRRGFHLLEGPGIAVRWPLLLAVSVRVAGAPREVLAYPARRAAVPRRALRSPAPRASSPVPASPMVRGGEVFRGVREWSAGDPPRAIAWRATARHGRLLSREFDREDSGAAVVLLDVRPGDPSHAVDRACSVAGSLLLRLRASRRRTAFGTYGPDPLFLPSVATDRSLGRALEALALLERPPRGSPPRDPLALVPPRALRGARVLVVRAAAGSVSSRRGARGVEVLEVPALDGAVPRWGPR